MRNITQPIALTALMLSLSAQLLCVSHVSAAPIPPAVLKALAPEDRKNATLIDPNRAGRSLGGDMAARVQAPVQIDDNSYRDSDGHLFAAPFAPPVGAKKSTRKARGLGVMANDDLYGSTISRDTKTGPYRGVYSKPGYSYEEASIYLPSGANYPPQVFVDIDHDADTPYVYMGGQGSKGGAVDAGLQHSAVNDNWALFLVAEGFGFHFAPGARFAPDQEIRLRFYVPADNYVAVSATGKDALGNVIDRTVVLDVSTFPTSGPRVPAGRGGQPTKFGWNANGQGNILKRLTSIAQLKQSWGTHSYTRGVRWHNMLIGTSPTNTHAWRLTDNGDTMTWPDTQRVTVRQAAPSDETISIVLNK